MDHWQERSWKRRHGLQPNAANDDFSNLLVPGVGLAPVTEFQILITLFAIVIGPLNYWLLKRAQRTHLMAITVPVAAVGLTVSLLLYALLGDGFGTKVRIRAVTLLDQPSGKHTTWGRLSYYVGLAPDDGLTLDDDCVMYPILPGWNDLNMAQGTALTREVVWSDGKQHLRGGWLRSRAPTQYLQVRTGKLDRRLDIDISSESQRVTNRLQADLELLLVLDDDGEIFQAENLGDGRETELQSIARLEAVRQLRTLVLQNEPYPPDGLVQEDDFSLVEEERRLARKRLERELSLQYSEARAGQSLLNTTIDELAGLTGGNPLMLPPRSYVAFTTTAVGVDLGLDSVRQLGGFQVVIGRW